MTRIISSRPFWVSVVLCGLVALAWVATISVALNRVPADEAVAVQAPCIGCGTEKVLIETTEDPEVNMANLQAAHADGMRRMRADQDARYKEFLKEHLKKMNTWHGTKVGVAVNVPESDRPLYEAIARVFADDPPAPEPRKKEFAGYLNGESRYKCVGWAGILSSVTLTDEGRVITVRVGPHLMLETGAVVFTPRECVETWVLSKAGKLKFVKAEFAGSNIVMIN